jgi:hypothetical protein
MPAFLLWPSYDAADITVTFVEKGYKPTFMGNYKSMAKYLFNFSLHRPVILGSKAEAGPDCSIHLSAGKGEFL